MIRETALELTVAAQFGCMTGRAFNRAGHSKGWVIFVDTRDKRFVAKASVNAHSYWRNFLYSFQPGPKRPTVVQCLQDMAAEVPREYWVAVFTTLPPNIEKIRSHGYVQRHAKHKGFRVRATETAMYEYKHKETGLSFFIAVASHVKVKDVWRRLIARITTVAEATDLPTRIENVKRRISEDASKCLKSACLVHAGADPALHFEVIERTDLKDRLMRDNNSGAGLVRTLNLNALTKEIRRLSAAE
jgi:hypothetical protein